MDSINKNQAEENYKALAGSSAMEKIRELAEKAETCFFCTRIADGQEIKTRPMAMQELDDQGNLWFLSASDSHKNQDILEDPSVQLFFQGSTHSHFLSLYGKASISTDRDLINKLWKPILKTWFTGGKDGPRITVIRVSPESGYYWDNKHGNAVAFAKMVAGAITSKTLDDSIEGKLNV